MTGKVYLTGAGPGDPGLITVKAMNCIKKADVIVYDNLVNEKLLFFAQESAEKIYAGKCPNNHTMPQEKINNLLLEKAKQGKIVVRLKGGDPFIFGRGGEEALFLKNHNIEFEIIPGVSSAVAAPAYAGIPVTHRGVSSSFHVITGHESFEKCCNDVDYEVLAKLSGTLVFLMGFSNLEFICSELIRNGKPEKTPAAVISNGTCPNQKVAVGTLENIKDKIKNLTSPAVIVVGEVVNLRESLTWWEQKPLFGRKIIVTRAKNQNESLITGIEEAGGVAIEFPTIEINSSNESLRCALALYESLNKYDWIIFTSRNGVEIFFKDFFSYHSDIRALGKAKICAIGKVTAESLKNLHLNVDFIPDEFTSESLVSGLRDRIFKGDTVLIPTSEQARDILPQELIKLGAKVDLTPIYKTIIPDYEEEELKNILANADTVCFTSSSTVENFVKILGEENLDFLKSVKIYCIGPVTADTARNFGIIPDKIALEHTIDGLIRALTEKH